MFTARENTALRVLGLATVTQQGVVLQWNGKSNASLLRCLFPLLHELLRHTAGSTRVLIDHSPHYLAQPLTSCSPSPVHQPKSASNQPQISLKSASNQSQNSRKTVANSENQYQVAPQRSCSASCETRSPEKNLSILNEKKSPRFSMQNSAFLMQNSRPPSASTGSAQRLVR